MSILKSFIATIAVSVSLMADAVTIKNPKCEYVFSAMKQVTIKRIELSNEMSVVTFCTNNVKSDIYIGRDIYVIEDGGKAHPAINITGAEFDKPICPQNGKTLEFTVTFEPCENPGTQCLDIISDNGRIYGIHDAGTSINVPHKEYKIDAAELQPKCFTMDSVEIDGKIAGYKSDIPQNIYCQYRHVYAVAGKDYKTRQVPLNADGTFHMKFAADHPDRVLFIVYDRDKKVHDGQMYPTDLYVRPGSRLNITMHTAEYDPENVWKTTEVQDLSGNPTYPELNHAVSTIAGAMSDMSKNDDFTPSGCGKLTEAYKYSMALANYIIWHHQFSESAAYLYLSGLRMQYVDYMTVATRDTNKRHPDTGSLDYSFVRELDPDDPGYFCQSQGLCSLPPLNDIRHRLEQELRQLPAPEREMKIFQAQNEELNHITGWTGVTLMMQLLYVQGFWKAIIAPNGNEEIREKDESILQAMLPQVTHPYLQNGIREVAHYEMSK